MTVRLAQIEYVIVRAFRIALSALTLTAPLSFFLHFIIGGGLIRAQAVQGTALLNYINAVVAPFLALSDQVLSFRPIWHGWNFLVIIMSMVMMIGRHIVMLPVDRLEHWAQDRFLKAKRAVRLAAHSAVGNPPSHSPQTNLVAPGQRTLAILSVGLLCEEGNSTHNIALRECRLFVESEFRSAEAVGVIRGQDELVGALRTCDEAVAIAKGVLSKLPFFHLPAHCAVRCGVSTGEVILPPEGQAGEMRGTAVGLATDMQQYADPGTLWVPNRVWMELQDQSGFRLIADQRVDGLEPYEWRAGEESAKGKA